MLSGQLSFWANVSLGKCLSGQLSSWANVLLGKRLLGKCLSGQMSFWANVFWANIFLGKCLFGQMSSGQMLSGQMSFWANVSGQLSLGKCRMGKCHGTIPWYWSDRLYEVIIFIKSVRFLGPADFIK
jgi:hypothetical protein